jgi:hypothetical protein
MHLGVHHGHDFYAGDDWEAVRPPHKRRSLRGGKRRHVGGRPGRGGRHGRLVKHHPFKGRAIIAFTRQGTSRTCLSSPARALLARIEAQFGPVGIVSTCRPGAVIAGSGRPSRHASGNAIDFNPPPGKKADVVRWLIANHRAGGVMTYADMRHIHVDIGHRFVALGAYSGRGGSRWR